LRRPGRRGISLDQYRQPQTNCHQRKREDRSDEIKSLGWFNYGLKSVDTFQKARDVLIAIHGGPGNSSDYMLSLEQLASDEFAVVNYDQRGTGQSTEPSNGYAMPNYVADLEALRQAVGAESVHLLGHSWGGLVALRYAAAHPQRVSSIILMGSGVLTPEAAQVGQRNHYSPTVEQMTWSALGNYDFTAGVDRLDHPVLVLWGEDDAFGTAYVEATKRALSAATV
jgi:pimeloyl-ACP methyl ester carboxylesterase